MARTNRAEAVAAPPPASVDALDDLNLDDMFEDGEDNLFDDLDIDLDGMGDLAGPNTRKDGAKISQDLDAMKHVLLGDDNMGSVPDGASKRRTTKRKIKPPPAHDDDDEDYELPSNKKRKSSKATSKKAKGSTKTSTQNSVVNSDGAPPARSKSSKSKTSTAMPPPYSRTASSESQFMVAASGQFGGRIQKKGASGVPLVRQTSKSKIKGISSPSSSVSSVGPLGDSPSNAKMRRSSSGSQSEGIYPHPESTFCGLNPSNTDFYPFMAALPPEPGMKRCHRMFPLMEKVHTTLSSTTPSPSSAPDAQETDPLFRLLAADLDQQHLHDKNSSEAAHHRRRTGLGHSAAMARQVVSQVEKNELLGDLRSVCILLKRQYDFLNQSLDNMEHWCKDHFTPQDFAAVYGSTKSGSALTSQSATSPPPQKAVSILASLKSPIVKVKIRCPGFKAPKMSGSLIANIRTHPSAPPPSGKREMTKSITSKPRKVSVTDADRSSVVSALSVPEVEEDVPYVDLKPWRRRQYVAEAVAERAQSLELQHRETQDKRKKSIERQRADLQKVVEDDELLNLNTLTMWKWLDKSAYFMDFSEADVREVLGTLWEPDVTESDSLNIPGSAVDGVMSEPTVERSTRIVTDGVPMDSFFVRLQSLLVEEGSAGEEEEDDDDDSILDGWEKHRGQGLPFDDFREADGPVATMDFTKLSIEERAYIHLRAVGLVDKSFVASMQPCLIEEDDSKSSNGKKATAKEVSKGEYTNVKQAEKGDKHAKQDGDDGIDTVILSMQADLQARRCMNNSRVAFLESTARSHLESMKQLKKKEEENAAILSKYNQLLKKQKEAKKSARQKPVKKDGDWVPW